MKKVVVTAETSNLADLGKALGIGKKRQARVVSIASEREVALRLAAEELLYWMDRGNTTQVNIAVKDLRKLLPKAR